MIPLARRPSAFVPHTVGVVIPVRNRPTSIVHAIRSVLHQSPPAGRIVVVDDGSTDATPREVQRMAREVDTLTIVTIPHSGPATARNRGLAALDVAWSAQGGAGAGDERLVAFLDSDDVWPRDFLGRALRRLFDGPEVGFVVSDRLEGFHDGGPQLHSARCFDADPWGALRRQSPRIMSCAVFRRQVLDQCPFPEGSLVGEDAALLIHLLARGTRSAWIAGAPVVAASIPPGDQDRVTTRTRSRHDQLRDRVDSAEVYAAALARSTAVPRRIAGRLLAARWMAVLGHSVAARNREGLTRALAELWRCGAMATARGVRDQCQALAGARPWRVNEG